MVMTEMIKQDKHAHWLLGYLVNVIFFALLRCCSGLIQLLSLLILFKSTTFPVGCSMAGRPAGGLQVS